MPTASHSRPSGRAPDSTRMPTAFLPNDQHVVGPLQPRRAAAQAGVGQVAGGERGDEGELGGLGRRRVGGGQQGGGEVAGLGGPGPAAAAAAGGLAPRR